jgi:hypothetical protein
LFNSADGGISYTEVADFSSQSVFGDARTTLADWAGGRVFDEASSLTVDVGDGELASTTRALMLADNSVNAAAIGVDGRWELIQFRTATLVSAGVYTLTGFLRGSRGTEWASTGHAAGEVFVLITAAGRRVVKQTSELGVEEDYKGVTKGRLLSSAAAEPFTANGVGQKPFAPVHVRVTRDASNNATIAWTRRTRLSTRFASSLGISAPLGEASERYEVEVYPDGTYTTVADTLTGITSPTVAYSAADQTGAGLTPGATLYLRVYMLNEIVSRGYAAEQAA